MSEYFDIICTCCDKNQIDMQILPKINRRKNQELFHTLYNRPKYVDPQILIQFFLVLIGLKGPLVNVENKNDSESLQSSYLICIRSQLLKNLDRVFNHVEFGRKLDRHSLTNVENLDPNFTMNNFASSSNATSGLSNTNSSYLTFIFRETMNLFADETLDSIIRLFSFKFNSTYEISYQFFEMNF